MAETKSTASSASCCMNSAIAISIPRLSCIEQESEDAKKAASSQVPDRASVSLKDMDNKTEEESCCQKFTSCRWVIGYMCCAARFSQAAVRQCIGIAVVCMTLRADTPASAPTFAGAPRIVGLEASLTWNDSLDLRLVSAYNLTTLQAAQFTWSPEFEGLILNSFNIGFFLSPIIGGHIAGTMGGKRVVLIALIVGAIVTICVPLAAKLNDICVILLRIIAGIFLGVIDPAIQALWAQWAPKYEKAKLTTCAYTGLSLAGILTFLISGHLCVIDIEHGWPFIFYFFGGFTFLCTIPWMLLVYDSPLQHPRILQQELQLIAKGRAPTTKTKMNTPWKSILTSGPFWAIAVAHICYNWVMTWMVAYMPSYLHDEMKFDVQENGLYSSLPYVGRLLTGVLCAYLSDWFQQMGLSAVNCRKLFQVVGSMGCAASLIIAGFMDHTSRAMAVVLLVLSMSFQNCTSVGFRVNHLDIAPRFAGVLMGMTLTTAMGCSLTAPPITAAIIKDGSQKEWMVLFIIAALLNVIGAVVFCIFASGDVQAWALPPGTPVQAVPVQSLDSHTPVRIDGEIKDAKDSY